MIDDPKDAERLAGSALLLVWAEALEANPEMSITDIAHASADDLPADLRALAEQFDAAARRAEALEGERIAEADSRNSWFKSCLAEQERAVAAERRAEALEAEVGRLRAEDEAARHDIERGLANLSSCEAEIGRLKAERDAVVDDFAADCVAAPPADNTETLSEMPRQVFTETRHVFTDWLQRRRSIRSGETPPPAADHAERAPPAADHAERARKLRMDMLEAECSNVLPGTEEGEDTIRHRHLWLIEQALAAAARAAAEKMRELAAQLVETHVEGNHSGVQAVNQEAGIARVSINGYAYATAIRALPLLGEE